jgi:hypothetical protein
MCCGQTEADVAGMFDAGEAARTAPLEAGMAKVYTARDGEVRSVAHYGDASFLTPAIVPAIVGVEMARAERNGKPLFRVEFEPGESEAGTDALSFLEGVATAQGASQGSGSDGQSEPFHAEGGKVHHTRLDCTKGNDIEQPIPGTGELPECPKCKKLAGASAQE